MTGRDHHPGGGALGDHELDTLEAARRFYHSPDYQEILPLRLAAAEGEVALVEGA